MNARDPVRDSYEVVVGEWQQDTSSASYFLDVRCGAEWVRVILEFGDVQRIRSGEMEGFITDLLLCAQRAVYIAAHGCTP